MDDQKVKDYFKQMFDNYGPFYTADPDKTTVEEGDIVNVDYVGKLDGTAFSGGTAENQNIDVYQNASAHRDRLHRRIYGRLKGRFCRRCDRL